MAGNASGNVIVTIDHVEKIYQGRSGEVVALNGVDMEIGENEFVCVVGPSGCGKSTLLNIIAGLEKPTSGRVCVKGKEVVNPGSERGVIFQQYALFPWLTVKKNVKFGLKLRGVKEPELSAIADKYIRLVGLEEFGDSYPKELSGGDETAGGDCQSLRGESGNSFDGRTFWRAGCPDENTASDGVIRDVGEGKKDLFFHHP